MTEHQIFGRRLRSGWGAFVALIRAPRTATSMIAGSFGAAIMLMSDGAAWPSSNITNTFASPAILEWVKGLLGLIFLLRRRLGGSQGD